MTTTMHAARARLDRPSEPSVSPRPRPVPGEAVPETAPPAAQPDSGPGPRGRRALGAVFVALLATVSGWAFCAGISVPWPWSDEGATFLALQRSYSQLLVLSHGPDAPLVPYYLVAKAWTQVVHVVAPAMPTLLAVRLLSATAGAATVLVLYALVSRNAGRLAGVLAGLLLVSLPGFDRLAQEARGYTLLALFATTSWLMWDRWLRPRRRPGFWPRDTDAPGPMRRGVRGLPGAAGYLASVVALALVHTFGLFQLPAQLLASAFAARPGQRGWWRPVVLTAAVLSLGGVLTGLQTWASLTHGTGSQAPNAARVVDLATIATQVTRGILLSTAPPAVAVVGVLAVVGLIGSRATRGFSVTVLVWLVVPLALELALSVARTNLFRSRYWVADLPATAAAAGVGLALLAQWAAAPLARALAEPSGVVSRLLRGAVASAVVVGILVVQLSAQSPAQAHLRAPRGHHSENLAPLLAVIDQTRVHHPRIPVLISSGPASGIVGAARPDLELRNPLRRLDPSLATVYTAPSTPAAVRPRIAGTALVLWVFRGELSATQAAARIPHGLSGLHARVVRAIPAGRWTAVLVHLGRITAAATTGHH